MPYYVEWFIEMRKLRHLLCHVQRKPVFFFYFIPRNTLFIILLRNYLLEEKINSLFDCKYAFLCLLAEKYRRNRFL